jgi:hypothetical protein
MAGVDLLRDEDEASRASLPASGLPMKCKVYGAGTKPSDAKRRRCSGAGSAISALPAAAETARRSRPFEPPTKSASTAVSIPR